MKKIFNISILSIFVFGVAHIMTSCGGKNDTAGKEEGLSGTVKVDGSSTVYPITEAVAEEFRNENKKVNPEIGISGTGGGFKKFIRNEIDIANASRPIKKGEDSACAAGGVEYLELPVAFDGLAVVVNPQNTWVNDITVAELKTLWSPEAQGKITKWNQVRSGWPNEEIHLFGAGTQSGTFDYFTEAINGKSKSCRGDYTASEDDNVLVQGISSDKNALGFFGLDYFTANKDKLKLVPVDDQKDENGKGPIAPSVETVKNATYQPLSRPLLIYVNTKALERKEVDAFVKYFLNNAESLVGEVGYVPLTKEMYDLVKKRFEAKKTGSAFLKLKSDVGIKMEDLLKME
jgi:phosphate transport system substrate-binding protein